MNDIDKFRSTLAKSNRIVGFTGAGISTESGIPDYRDEAGEWKRQPPVNFRDFTASDRIRRRYWARSFLGWEWFSKAGPNAGHLALADLEATGSLDLLVTQNVDGLHQAAGSRRVLDLHGRLDTVRCLTCHRLSPRADLQEQLRRENPGFDTAASRPAPDGDADVTDAREESFRIEDCAACGGILKPDVVFFGESVPRDRVEAAYAALGRADLLLVAGTSLKVWSGYRFAKAAAEQNVPIAVVNLGTTRADGLATVRVRGRCGDVLPVVVSRSG
jgi:NAD-dependent SIR2 family protein deacetylase